MKVRYFKHFVVAVIALLSASSAEADYPIEWEASLMGTLGSGDFTPFYISANRQGKLTQAKNALIDLKVAHTMGLDTRFSYGWGVEALAGKGSKVVYSRWNPSANAFAGNPQAPASVWLQQLYAEVKYRGVYLTAGLKERGSVLLNNHLSSGDVTWSGNARPMPEVRAGFVDFQNIPYTRQWLQIEGAVSYGWFTDNDWARDHFNYYSGQLCTDLLWIYKRIYFRTRPTERFHVVIGVQNTGLFGGTTRYYSGGKLTRTTKNWSRFKDYWEMLVPRPSNKEGYFMGDHKGSWDFKATYRLKNGDELMGYFEWFWEDGSGMAKCNGWDGLWGLEYKRATRGWINGAVVEYLDFTNQSGPLHWDPADHDNPQLNTQVRGADNYYNNGYYRSYNNFGMTIGTPMVMGPIYNVDGSSAIVASRVRGVHVALTGSIGSLVDWTVKWNHRKAWGPTNSYLLIHPLHSTSYMAEAVCRIPSVPGLKVRGEVGVDRGTMPANAAGVMVGVTYNGLFNIGKKK